MVDVVELTVEGPEPEDVESRDLGDAETVWWKGLWIGSDPKCRIVLHGDGIAPRHAKLVRAGQHYAFEEVRARVVLEMGAEEDLVLDPAAPTPPRRVEVAPAEGELPTRLLNVRCSGASSDPAPFRVGPYRLRVRTVPGR